MKLFDRLKRYRENELNRIAERESHQEKRSFGDVVVLVLIATLTVLILYNLPRLSIILGVLGAALIGACWLGIFHALWPKKRFLVLALVLFSAFTIPMTGATVYYYDQTRTGGSGHLSTQVQLAYAGIVNQYNFQPERAYVWHVVLTNNNTPLGDVVHSIYVMLNITNQQGGDFGPQPFSLDQAQSPFNFTFGIYSSWSEFYNSGRYASSYRNAGKGFVASCNNLCWDQDHFYFKLQGDWDYCVGNCGNILANMGFADFYFGIALMPQYVLSTSWSVQAGLYYYGTTDSPCGPGLVGYCKTYTGVQSMTDISPGVTFFGGDSTVQANRTARIGWMCGDDDGSVTTINVDFGDGASAWPSGCFLGSLDHVYTRPGAYLVTLTVTDDVGLTGTTSSYMTVTASPSMSGLTGCCGGGGHARMM